MLEWAGRPVARVSDTLLHSGGDARHSWPGSTLAWNPTQVTQVSRTKVGDLVIGIQLMHGIFSINSRMVGHVTMTSPMVNNSRVEGYKVFWAIFQLVWDIFLI